VKECEIIADNLSKAGGAAAVSQTRIKGRFIVRADERRTAFLELLHVLLSTQIKIGHATVWMRTRVCVSFIVRPFLLPFGFVPWFACILDIHRIADARRGDGKRFVVRADEKLTAFSEL
jgi:hypothetical protein